jgi:hypothetical protein
MKRDKRGRFVKSKSKKGGKSATFNPYLTKSKKMRIASLKDHLKGLTKMKKLSKKNWQERVWIDNSIQRKKRELKELTKNSRR